MIIFWSLIVDFVVGKECNKNFVKLNDECIYFKELYPHCLTLINNKCVECVNGYYLSNENNVCLKNMMENCLEFNKNNNSCVTCMNNYFLNQQGICEQCKDYSVRNCYPKIF